MSSFDNKIFVVRTEEDSCKNKDDQENSKETRVQ